jgi:hypothetical protein
MHTFYKIFEVKGETIKPLFHKRKPLPRGEWLKADKVEGRDGGNSRRYLTGWHLFDNLKTAEKYFSRFRDRENREILKCNAFGLRIKPTNSDVYLADFIKIKGGKYHEKII